MQILVETENGKIIPIKVTETDPISSIMEKVREIEGTVTVDQQTSVSRPLCDCQILEEKDLKVYITTLNEQMVIFVDNDNYKITPIEVTETDLISSIREKVREIDGTVSNNQTLTVVDQQPSVNGPLCEQDLKVYIKTLNESDCLQVNLTLEVKSFDTIRDIIIKIWDLLEIPISLQALVLDNGRVCTESTTGTLFENGITNGSTLGLIVDIEEKILVRITTFIGQNVAVQALLSDTIQQVKVKLERDHEIPPNQLSLTLDGVKLEDMHTLAYYKIGPNSIIECQLMADAVVVFIKTKYGRIAALSYDPFNLIEERDKVNYIKIVHPYMLNPVNKNVLLQFFGAVPTSLKVISGEHLLLAIR